MALSPAFTVVSSPVLATTHQAPQSLRPSAAGHVSGGGSGAGLAACGLAAAGVRRAARKQRSVKGGNSLVNFGELLGGDDKLKLKCDKIERSPGQHRLSGIGDNMVHDGIWWPKVPTSRVQVE